MAKISKPSVFIVDTMLPGEEGIRFYHCIKMEKDLQHTPVILLSSIDKPTFYRYQKQQWLRRGQKMLEPEAFLEKPLEADILLRAVRLLCEAGTDGPKATSCSKEGP